MPWEKKFDQRWALTRRAGVLEEWLSGDRGCAGGRGKLRVPRRDLGPTGGFRPAKHGKEALVVEPANAPGLRGSPPNSFYGAGSNKYLGRYDTRLHPNDNGHPVTHRLYHRSRRLLDLHASGGSAGVATGRSARAVRTAKADALWTARCVCGDVKGPSSTSATTILTGRKAGDRGPRRRRPARCLDRPDTGAAAQHRGFCSPWWSPTASITAPASSRRAL